MVLDVRTLQSASGLEVSDDLRPTTRKVRFGDAVTFTFRLVDDEGDPVLQAGVKFTVRAEESRDNGRHFEGTVFTKETGPDGTVRVTFRHADPSSPTSTGHRWPVSSSCSPRETRKPQKDRRSQTIG